MVSQKLNNYNSEVDNLDCKWMPTQEQIKQSQITKFVAFVNSKPNTITDKINIDSLHAWSIDNPTLFWSLFWEYSEVIASHNWDTILVNPDDMLNAKWFVGSKLNYAQNLLRYRNEDPAIIFRNESHYNQKITSQDTILNNSKDTILTHNQLYNAVAVLANSMKQHGVKCNDRVVGLMPNLPQTVIAMLATASIGAVWSSCSPDYGVQGVLDRFGQIEPKLLFTVNGYFYNDKKFDCTDKITQIINQLPSLEVVVVYNYIEKPSSNQELNNTKINNLVDYLIDNIVDNIHQPTPQILSWNDFNSDKYHTDKIDFAQVDFDHQLFIMYSSGTTGIPKCIVHGAGGTLIQHLKEHILHTNLVYGKKIFYYTTCGWMMWNWLVSSLATGAVVVLYDGSPMTPTPSAMWDYIIDHKINIFGTSAKYISALEKSGYSPIKPIKPIKNSPDGLNTPQLDSLEAILSTGSPLLPENYDYVYSQISPNVRLCSISGGTDIIACFALGNPTKPIYRGELQQIGFGLNIQILDELGNKLANGEKGELCCLSPFPSQPIYFWDDPKKTKYYNAYFAKIPNVWCHGDFASITPHKGLIIYGRSDTTLNPGGIRIGTAEIYRQVESIREVAEAVAVGHIVNGNEKIILFVKLQKGYVLDEALNTKIKHNIKVGASPHHVPSEIFAVIDIPRTINGKIAELAVKNVIHGETVKNKEALSNPESLKFFEHIFQ